MYTNATRVYSTHFSTPPEHLQNTRDVWMHRDVNMTSQAADDMRCGVKSRKGWKYMLTTVY